jgi:hypothetical protein
MLLFRRLGLLGNSTFMAVIFQLLSKKIPVIKRGVKADRMALGKDINLTF